MKFDQCGQRYMANTTDGAELRAKYGWHGPVVGIRRNETSQISLEGCLAVCGHDSDPYSWDIASATITTWILPVIGTLLQAPFESNSFKRTCLAINRWVGSPIASLSYILWNIKVNAKCALIADMAVKYDDYPARKTDFGSMRDSLYLLVVMNQYSMKPQAALQKEAEGLLRIALFSKDLRLVNDHDTLRTKRRRLARELREMRRRGVVPVFISTMWFVFAFVLSIQSAFNALGENSTAHDLALGCLLAWFPTLILCTIADRNPIAAESIRKKLNELIDHVRSSIQDDLHRSLFISSFRDQPEFDQLKEWLDKIKDHSDFMGNFFTEFAGQARVRWHYGAAHPILSDIENCYVAERGRDWLADEKKARTNLVLGSVEEGLIWFDIRELWQITSAIIIVLGGCAGAFAISFFTPTVGLGCRSGGYVIFFSLAFVLIVAEMIVWWMASDLEMVPPNWMARTSSRLHSTATFAYLEEESHNRWAVLKRRTSAIFRNAEDQFVRLVRATVGLFPLNNKIDTQDKADALIRRLLVQYRAMSLQRRCELFIFRPLELINCSWLIYIVMAQTFGTYRNCHCVTSTWGGAGGYLDFTQQDTTNNEYVAWYWGTGTLLASATMGISMFYITVEWMQQSWLHTEDYNDAMDGLRKMRTYKRYTYWFRIMSRYFLLATVHPIHGLFRWVGIVRKRQKSLLWTRHGVWGKPTPSSSPSYTQPLISDPHPSGTNHHFPSISIDLAPIQRPITPHNGLPVSWASLSPPVSQPMTRNSSSDSSLHTPTHTQNRPRYSSDASLLPYRPPNPDASTHTLARPRSSTDVSTRTTSPLRTPFIAHIATHVHRDSDASNPPSPRLLHRLPYPTHSTSRTPVHTPISSLHPSAHDSPPDNAAFSDTTAPPTGHWTDNIPSVFEDDSARRESTGTDELGSPHALLPASPPSDRDYYRGDGGGWARGLQDLTVRQGYRRASSSGDASGLGIRVGDVESGDGRRGESEGSGYGGGG
ncbi:hypothetical protein EJ05DRAFT_539505 [Pseudovirgaria hyperparasitica]|uniref:Uncharacterized protein n=1 Tax=Pseudovirgaria hyperparasitica TaxID=470096 RepID=A0A6A6W0Y9_9PEZI|nr:uncharacterized protein EJ05DRAFT_539505 [Pseudovirgaria hyperparasitica]KAF2756578.1 hypothetical protein EJ05DRAFT_539505 [Pseudovirgaria hyperparasitica]